MFRVVCIASGGHDEDIITTAGPLQFVKIFDTATDRPNLPSQRRSLVYYLKYNPIAYRM